MSNIKILASKKEIFFSADHELFLNNDLSMIERYLNSFVISVSNATSNSKESNNNNSNSSFTIGTNGSNEDSPPSSPLGNGMSFFF
jgi:hypothetical protein